MLAAILILCAVILGLLVVLAWFLSRLPGSLAHSQSAPLGDLRAALEKSLGDQKADFRDVSSASGEQLRQLVQQSLTNQQLVLEQRFAALQQQTDTRLQEIRVNVEKRLQENLEQNFGAFKEMSQSLTLLKSSADQMLKISEQVGELNHILASPKLQGNFGETALEKILSDILPPSAYEWQPRLAEGLQPDASIKIKNVRLCIDAKFPKDRIAGVLDAARDETARELARKEMAGVIKLMAADISKKYVRPDLGTADQAFLFVPSESLYYEILQMPELVEHCRKVKVTPVSPNTLAATLYAVALAFRGYEMQENAKTLLKGIQDMDRHFQNFREDFQKVGQRIQQAQDDYSKAGRDLDRFDKTIAKLKEGEGGLQLE
jgi:DNA recombination protein RmuC